jgi:hypothetical protein
MPRRSYRGAGGASSRGDIEAGQPAGGETSPRSPRAAGATYSWTRAARPRRAPGAKPQDPTAPRKIGRPHARGTAPGGIDPFAGRSRPGRASWRARETPSEGPEGCSPCPTGPPKARAAHHRGSDIEAGQPAGGRTSPRSPRARGRDVQLDAGSTTWAGAGREAPGPCSAPEDRPASCARDR